MPNDLYFEHQIGVEYEALVTSLNNAAIFIAIAVPILQQTEPISSKRTWRNFQVPGISGTSDLFRSNDSIRKLYEHGVSRQIFESYLLTAVSQCETFIFDVLKLVLTKHPKLLMGKKFDELAVPFDVFLGQDKEQIIAAKIKAKLSAISYQSPREQLAYLERVAGVKTSSVRFKHYCEIKATRDILVHNAGIIDEKYITKSGDKARGKVGELIHVDEAYFNESVTWIKRIANSIQVVAIKTVTTD